MLKQTLFAIACASMFVGACVTSPNDVGEGLSDEEATSVETSELEAVPYCQDLLNEVFWIPTSCTKNGQLGIKDCYKTCDIYRSLHITPTFPVTYSCQIDESVCDPPVCGPCEVVEWEGPLP